MKNKFITNIKSLFKSSIDNKELFERRNYSLLFPIILYVIVIFMMCIPSYFSSKNVDKNTVLNNFPEVKEPIKVLLTSSIDCSIKDNTLTCASDEDRINAVVGEDIKYTIIVNQPSISIDTNVTYNTPKDSDNLIILLSKYIRIRYVERNHITQEVETSEIIGDYSNLERFNFKSIASEISENPEILDEEIIDFVYNSYSSTLDTKLLVSLSSSLVSFTMFILVSCIALKGPYLFKRKKGLTFIECLKISLSSCLPAIIISTILLVVSIEFSMSFGLIYLIRMIYIYFKYILSNKNNIYKQLYEKTNEERFKVLWLF